MNSALYLEDFFIFLVFVESKVSCRFILNEKFSHRFEAFSKQFVVLLLIVLPSGQKRLNVTLVYCDYFGSSLEFFAPKLKLKTKIKDSCYIF